MMVSKTYSNYYIEWLRFIRRFNQYNYRMAYDMHICEINIYVYIMLSIDKNTSIVQLTRAIRAATIVKHLLQLGAVELGMRRRQQMTPEEDEHKVATSCYITNERYPEIGPMVHSTD